MSGGEDHGETSPGAVIGDRYVLDERIGRGGMADVYRARDLHLDRTVAVKVFRPGGDPEGARRLVAEARLLAPLDHPSVVALSDGGVDESRPFLVMPLVTGGTLADRLAAGPLPVPEVTRLGRELAGALAYLHRRGIVHRDVKPSNVLLDEDGRPLLGDFDVSRFVGSMRLTTTGQIVGTAAYLAPEQVRGAGGGPAADVYALGLVLIECLTGRPAYVGTNQISIATARLHREADVPGGLPDEVRAVLAAMVATDENRRPAAATCATWLAAASGEVPLADAAATVVLPVVRPGHDAEARPSGPFRSLTAVVMRGTRRAAVAGVGLALVAVAAAAGALPVTLGAGQPPAEHIPSSGGTPSARPTAPPPTVPPTGRPSAQPTEPSPTVSSAHHRSVVTSAVPASTRAHRDDHGERQHGSHHHGQHGHGPGKPHRKHGGGGGHGPGAPVPPAPPSSAAPSPAPTSPAPTSPAPPSAEF